MEREGRGGGEGVKVRWTVNMTEVRVNDETGSGKEGKWSRGEKMRERGEIKW